MTTLPESERAPVGSEEAAAGPESELVRRILAKTDEAEAALRALLAPDAGPDVAALSAAKRAERDRELVHDYRVALRRLRSILRLVAPAFGKKKVRKLVDAIREAGALTGDLRDEEVLRETLTELKPASSGEVHLERWMFGRARRERGQRSRVVKVIRAHGDRGEGVARALANVRARLSRPPGGRCPTASPRPRGSRRRMAGSASELGPTASRPGTKRRCTSCASPSSSSGTRARPSPG